jgi:hypothetical protein
MSSAQNEQAAGSAGHYEQVVFVEVPLPWTRDVWDSRQAPQGIAELVSEAVDSGRLVRAMGVVPHQDRTVDGTFRVIAYRRPNDDSPTYQRTAYRAMREDIPMLLRWLLGLKAERPDNHVVDTEVVDRELFVCTHGSRDACCGRLGFPIYARLQDKVGAEGLETLKVWRCSHTGGHRFAPTAVDFPTGVVWGRLHPDKVDQLLCSKEGWQNFKDNYRGWLAVDAICQHADRELFERRGWDWLQVPRRAQVKWQDVATSRCTVRIESQAGPSRKRIEEVVLNAMEPAMVFPSCGADFPKAYPQFEVLSVVDVSGSTDT